MFLSVFTILFRNTIKDYKILMYDDKIMLRYLYEKVLIFNTHILWLNILRVTFLIEYRLYN